MDINSPALQHQSVLLEFSWEMASRGCQCVTFCLQALLPSSRAVTWHREINPTLRAQRGSKKVLGVSPAGLLTLQPPQCETDIPAFIKQAGFLSQIQAGTISAGNWGRMCNSSTWGTTLSSSDTPWLLGLNSLMTKINECWRGVR